ncbi:MAG: hypothetical protein WAM70_13245, partial [Pyrinomonadaceae bacterium]
MKTLSQEISGYAEAVKELSEANNSDLSSATLRALIARDKAATTLGKEGINSSHIDCVAKTDRQLRDQATRVDSAIGRETLQQWRLTRTPDDKAWWWSLDDLAATSQSKRVWTVIAVFLLTIAVYFAVDTFNLLRTVGESPIGTLGALIQGSLAVVAASAFTEAGRKRFVSALTHFGFKGRPFKGFARMLLATAVLALTIVIHSLLPASVAYYFQRQGERFQSEGLVQRAISAYQQALLLQPYSIPTHLALAKAAEKANDYAKAIAEYKSTIVLYEQTRKPDDSYYEAQINLARLLIQHEKNYSQVLRMLDKPEEMIGAVSPQNRKPYTYFFWTYRGWA